jgi:hypothetical protein
MSDDSQILIARLMAHQTLRRDDKMVKRALSDEQFRAELDARLAACGMKLLDNVYADHVTLALQRNIEPKVFGARDTWQNNNFGLARDGVALLVVLWALIILPKRERQETHQAADVPRSRCRVRKTPRSASRTRRCWPTSATSWARRPAWT